MQSRQSIPYILMPTEAQKAEKKKEKRHSGRFQGALETTKEPLEPITMVIRTELRRKTTKGKRRERE